MSKYIDLKFKTTSWAHEKMIRLHWVHCRCAIGIKEGGKEVDIVEIDDGYFMPLSTLEDTHTSGITLLTDELLSPPQPEAKQDVVIAILWQEDSTVVEGVGRIYHVYKESYFVRVERVTS